jgi:hypothetical protein
MPSAFGVVLRSAGNPKRTPLRVATLVEIGRIAKRGSTVILRHASPPWSNPHRLALRILQGNVERITARIGRQILRETTIDCFGCTESFADHANSDDLIAELLKTFAKP